MKQQHSVCLLIQNLIGQIFINMPIQKARITLTPNDQSSSGLYFKLVNQEVFISKVSEGDRVVENLFLTFQPEIQIQLEIWAYEPYLLLKKCSLTCASFDNPRKKWVKKDPFWTVSIQLNAEHQQPSMNIQCKRSKEKRIYSSSKLFKILEKKKSRKKSNCKDSIIAVVNKNKDKVSIKKALKHTLQCLIRPETELQRYEDYGNSYSKTAKCSPSIQLLSSIKNHSVLYSEYGFSSNQFNKLYESKYIQNVENQENIPQEKPQKKKKTRTK